MRNFAQIRVHMRVLVQTIWATIGIVLIAPFASAGDFAEFRPIGFSSDGGVFAFEQFGIQDGSGFAYAERYYIDTANDNYLPGSPIRVVLEDENATVNDARAVARSQANQIETDSGATAEPGTIAAFSPPTEQGHDDAFLRYQSVMIVPQTYPGRMFSVELSELSLPPPPMCADLGQTVAGFKLVMKENSGEPQSILFHADQSIPSSRNCPISYALAGAMTHLNPDGSTTHAILVLMRSVGFEGPNGRYLAVTKRIN